MPCRLYSYYVDGERRGSLRQKRMSEIDIRDASAVTFDTLLDEITEV